MYYSAVSFCGQTEDNTGKDEEWTAGKQFMHDY